MAHAVADVFVAEPGLRGDSEQHLSPQHVWKKSTMHSAARRVRTGVLLSCWRVSSVLALRAYNSATAADVGVFKRLNVGAAIAANEWVCGISKDAWATHRRYSEWSRYSHEAVSDVWPTVSGPSRRRE